MKREIIETSDGSKTIFIPDMNENYHSGHGAYQEAMHVFIEHGIRRLNKKELTIFEMGFGTGLNALLSLDESFKNGYAISYTGIEAYPVELDQAFQMEYEQFVDSRSASLFRSMHLAEWGIEHELSSTFRFKKLHERIEDHQPERLLFDLLFFDAFGPRAQAEMWEMPILEKMHDMLKPEGLMVTYCAKGQFKRDLKTLGFEVYAVPGPPGKREMTQAFKKG